MNSTLKLLGNDLARTILRHVITPEDAPHGLLRMFTGARKVEADGCLWPHLLANRRGVMIATSSGHRRLVPTCQAFNAWLEPYFGLCGRIDPNELADRHFQRKLRRLGIDLPAWAFRKNYALNRLALGIDCGQVLRELGYKTALPLFVTPIFNPTSGADAQEFFGLTPEACGRPQWPSEVARWRRQLSPN